MDAKEQLQLALQKHRCNLTFARCQVFTALQQHEPQTMRELVGTCRDIDRASVYRTVSLFERLHIVQRLSVGWTYKLELSDAFQPHHHHLSCRRCGRTLVLPQDSILEQYITNMAAPHGFVLLDHQLEIRGLCRKCQQSRQKVDPA